MKIPGIFKFSESRSALCGPLNILFSSTRQWNPGDEFIFFGIRHLFEEIIRDRKINWVLYDRNPDLNINGFTDRTHKENIWGNSFHQGDPGSINIALIAGTPEWFDLPLTNFYRAVQNEQWPLFLIGLGYIDAPINFSENELYCLKNLSKVITARDEYASRELAKEGIPSELLPCPALFALSTEIIPTKIRRIGFILQTGKTTNQLIPQALTETCINTIKKLRMAGRQVDVICHYIDEFTEFSRTLSPVRYSYDARDYIEILADYDLIISTRLHGAILANSVGKPAILLNVNDSRCNGAAALFPCIYSAPPDYDILINLIDSLRVSHWKRLPQWKADMKSQYLNILRNALIKLL